MEGVVVAEKKGILRTWNFKTQDDCKKCPSKQNEMFTAKVPEINSPGKGCCSSSKLKALIFQKHKVTAFEFFKQAWVEPC